MNKKRAILGMMLLLTYAANASPLQHLMAKAPPSLQVQLAGYAKRQGASSTEEINTIITHELIHIESAAQQGYWVSGQLYDGYDLPLWKTIQISDVPKLQIPTAVEAYARAAPTNHLGNVLDEINAYTQTLPCSRPYTPRHTGALLGHLQLANALIDQYRLQVPQAWEKLRQPPARGLLETLLTRSYKALGRCGIDTVTQQGEVLKLLNR